MSARTIAMPILILLFIFIVALLPRRSVLSANQSSTAFLFTVTRQYEALAWLHAADRFSPDAAIYFQDATGRHALVPGFAASVDPNVSFDGTKVLFAGKQNPSDPWQIWEVPTSGGDPQRVISCTQDCVRPFYLPEDRVVYAEKKDGRFVIKILDRADRKVLQLTYGPGSSLPTDILRDGRILFEGAYPFGKGEIPELYTAYSDGSGVEAYRCDHGKARHSGTQVTSGDIVFVSDSGLGKFTSPLAHSVPIPAPVGEYAGEVAEASSGDFLIPWRTRTNPFQLMWWTPGTASLRPATAELGANVLQPVLIHERPVPNRHPSGLHDWNNANLLCLNAYTSKYKFAAGSIKSVRLYSIDSMGNTKLLGSAPVESDGSFFVQLPTEAPLQIELLDSAGKTLKRESGWFWMRHGEQRACVGCHAGPETAPENAVPMTLLKSTTPVDMTGNARGSAGGN